MTTFLVRIRKDGTILIPKEVGWGAGEMLEITDTSNSGSWLCIINIKRNFERLKAENEGR